jgi:hypothetical protein
VVAQRPQHQVARLLAQHREEGHAHALVPVEHGAEGRRLGDLQAHVQAYAHQRSAGEERDSPAPARNSASDSTRIEQNEHGGRTQEPDRRAELREHAVPGALARRRDSPPRAAPHPPLAAEPEPLAEPAERQQRRRRQADRA